MRRTLYGQMYRFPQFGSTIIWKSETSVQIDTSERAKLGPNSIEIHTMYFSNVTVIITNGNIYSQFLTARKDNIYFIGIGEY